MKLRQEQEKERQIRIAAGEVDSEETLPLPSLPYVCWVGTSLNFLLLKTRSQWKCREIMTRADFIEGGRR